jgi:tRNA pseudouridine38-40 synthase
MPRYALLLAYDGTDFAGWWRQPGLRTVAGELDAACARVGEPEAAALGASRTDAGVHAFGQLAHIDTRRTWRPDRLAAVLARQLPSDLALRGVAAVDPDWHAVHGVRRKTYRYRIDPGMVPDPFAARFAWRQSGLDLACLGAAARLVPGRRDWSAFVRRGEHRADTECRVLACRWLGGAGGLRCEISADAFIYRMVRSLVGGMALVGRGGASLDAWQAALDGRTSEPARQQAPAHGLTLLRVVHRHAPDWATP